MLKLTNFFAINKSKIFSGCITIERSCSNCSKLNGLILLPLNGLILFLYSCRVAVFDEKITFDDKVT